MFFRTLLNNITALDSFKTQLQSSSLPVLLTACTGSLYCCLKSLVLASGSAKLYPLLQHPPLVLPFSLYYYLLTTLHSTSDTDLLSLFSFHFTIFVMQPSFPGTPSKRIYKIIIFLLFSKLSTTTLSASSRSSLTYCLINKNLKRQKLFGTLT